VVYWVRRRTETRLLQRVLLVGQFVTEGLEARALFESGPLCELLDLGFECAYMRLVLAHQRLELHDVFFFRLVDATCALSSLLARIACLVDR
jgi:hypothetical protein